jgi:hypothetical protein
MWTITPSPQIRRRLRICLAAPNSQIRTRVRICPAQTNTPKFPPGWKFTVVHTCGQLLPNTSALTYLPSVHLPEHLPAPNPQALGDLKKPKIPLDKTAPLRQYCNHHTISGIRNRHNCGFFMPVSRLCGLLNGAWLLSNSRTLRQP